MGLLWSQRPVLPEGVSQRGQQPVFHASPEQPLMTTLQAHALAEGEAGRVSATLVQRLTNPDVTRHEVREDGLVGTLFLPPGPGPHPAVMVLNGSGGGINEPRAALLASRGYAAFALGYFKALGLPDYISNTPLELFARGIDVVTSYGQAIRGFCGIERTIARRRTGAATGGDVSRESLSGAGLCTQRTSA